MDKAFVLYEVMISLIMLSCLVMFLYGLYPWALQTQREAYLTSLAHIKVGVILDITVASQVLAQHYLIEWQQAILQAFPQGSASLLCTIIADGYQCMANITWWWQGHHQSVSGCRRVARGIVGYCDRH